MKRKFRTQYMSDYKGDKGTVISGESMTVPDEHLTIQQLLENHTRGLIPPGAPSVYTEDEEALRFNDLTEHMEYINNLQEEARELNEEIKQEKAKAKKRKQDEQRAEKQKETPTPTPPQEKPTDPPQNED